MDAGTSAGQGIDASDASGVVAFDVGDAEAVPSCRVLELGSALGTSVATGTTEGLPSLQDTVGCGTSETSPRAGSAAGELVYRWTAPATGTYRFSTLGSRFNTLLYVREGSCTGAELACTDDGGAGSVWAEAIALDLTAGQVVFVVVDGAGGAAGSTVLSISRQPPPCVPRCGGRVCGDNGCGGSCGACVGRNICDASGRCIDSCVPRCTGRVCGNDGCGSTCGTCTGSDTCDSAGRCVDLRTPADRACPRGATLRLQLWQVTATPNTPAGASWDGPGATKRAFACGLAASAFRSAVQGALATYVGPVGETIDRWFGWWYEAEFARLCGLAAGWLFDRYAGPDLYAIGYSNGGPIWQTRPDDQDRWVAPQVAGAWTGAVWRLPCQSTSPTVGFDVMDEDVAFDDLVEVAQRLGVEGDDSIAPESTRPRPRCTNLPEGTHPPTSAVRGLRRTVRRRERPSFADVGGCVPPGKSAHRGRGRVLDAPRRDHRRDLVSAALPLFRWRSPRQIRVFPPAGCVVSAPDQRLDGRSSVSPTVPAGR